MGLWAEAATTPRAADGLEAEELRRRLRAARDNELEAHEARERWEEEVAALEEAWRPCLRRVESETQALQTELQRERDSSAIRAEDERRLWEGEMEAARSELRCLLAKV